MSDLAVRLKAGHFASYDVGEASVSATLHRMTHHAKSRLQFEIAGLPSLVKPGFQRPVEAQKDAVSSARHGLHPVPFIAGRRFRSEPDRSAAVRVLLESRK